LGLASLQGQQNTINTKVLVPGYVKQLSQLTSPHHQQAALLGLSVTAGQKDEYGMSQHKQ
jgi:hypothetical protein